MKEINLKLTRKERDYIIEDLLSVLESHYYGSDSITLKKLMKLKHDKFGVKEWEFEIVKSIVKKLGGGING